jgi:flagellin-like hook-associated protein FlgL
MIPSLSPSLNLFLNGLSRLQSTITTATSQLSSGYRINQPSDAPDQISPLLQLQASLNHNQAAASNLTQVQADVSSADQAVSTAIQLLDQATSLGAQGASSTVTGDTRQNLAQQVQSIQDQMVALANTQVSGRYIFSGDQDTSQSYSSVSNPPVQLGQFPATVVLPTDTAVFNVQTTSGLSTITITGQVGDSVQSQMNNLNSQLQAGGLGISASLDGSGNLQFQSAGAFSVSAQATNHGNLVPLASETANNTGLNYYQFNSQTPTVGTGGSTVKITAGGISAIATLTNPGAPTSADITSINAALQAQGVTSVSAVLDETAGNTKISFQGSVPFSISDDHAVAGTYVADGNSVPPTGVERNITPAATRQIELSDRSFTTVDLTAQTLFDHRSTDGSPAQDNVFAALNSLRIALADTTNPNQQATINAAQTSLKRASTYLNTQETFYGNIENRISAATTRISTENTSLQQQISAIRDTDVVQTALQLTSAETQNQAALASEAKVPHTSLFDFLG